MKKCLIWGTGNAYKLFYKIVKYYVIKQEIEIVGITSNESHYKSINGIQFIEKCALDVSSFDTLIVMAFQHTWKSIYKEAIALGIDDSIIIPIEVMTLPGFDFEKYQLIRKNVPTIIAPLCWGGVLYNRLGLEFKSPFINMFVLHDDYLKILKNISLYMETPLEFEKMGYEEILKREYPIVRCADVTLHFNHYITFEEAKACWERRKKRIDMENIYAMYFDDNISRINEFLELDYKKKVCFVPYSLEKQNCFFLDFKKNEEIINEGASGFIYDVFELLLNNQLITLSELN